MIGVVGAISWLEINKQICDNVNNYTSSYILRLNWIFIELLDLN